MVSVSICPSEGEIGPREQRRCRLDFISRIVGPLSGMRIACQVDGMGKPVYLSLAADVAGLRSVEAIQMPTSPSLFASWLIFIYRRACDIELRIRKLA